MAADANDAALDGFPPREQTPLIDDEGERWLNHVLKISWPTRAIVRATAESMARSVKPRQAHPRPRVSDPVLANCEDDRRLGSRYGIEASNMHEAVAETADSAFGRREASTMGFPWARYCYSESVLFARQFVKPQNKDADGRGAITGATLPDAGGHEQGSCLPFAARPLQT